ncbi:PglL family O-oligosaccharyltransferase [Acinetobacter indicus]|uniref:PglL family O-oligosaccharyltransferase n=1 Tax=Acinetobacter indicus TaxID=756892 RepID=UPI0014440546|nr:O-antigen ligase family protein [Acinetobacter indicus]
MSKLLILLIVILLGFAWLTPNHIFPWVTSHSEFSIFFALLLLFAYTVKNNRAIYLYKKNTIFLLISFIPIIQAFFDKVFFWGDAYISSLYIFGFIIALTIGNSLGKEDSSREKSFLIFSYIVIGTVLILILLQLCQWFSLNINTIYIAEMPPNGRPFANFGQPNTLATFLIFGIFSVLFLYERYKIGVFVCVLVISIILFGIVLTQSRTPWVFAIFFLIWWFWKAKKSNLRIKTNGIFLGYAIYIFLLYLMPFISDYLLLSFSTVQQRATTGFQRLDMWQQMLIAIKNEPWLGYGWQQVSVAQVENTQFYPNTGWTEHSHNIILDLLIWNGIPLGFLIIFLIAWWLSQFIDLAHNAENFLFLSLTGALLVHGMLEYPLEYAFLLLPVGFLLGLIQVSSVNYEVNNSFKYSFVAVPKCLNIVILILFVTIYTLVFTEYRIIEKDAQQARYEALNIGTLYAQHRAPDVLVLTQLQAQIALMRTQPNPHMSEEEIEFIKRVAYRYATKAALIRYSQVLALNGHKEEALKHLDIIEKMYQAKISYEALLNVDESLAFMWKTSENENE